MNALRSLHRYGQVPWLDFVSRGLLKSGRLRKLVEEEGLTGVTSNPAIFRKAIGEGADYDSAVAALLDRADDDALSLYERLAIEDIRQAADILEAVYRRTNGADGFVSLEVSPHLADDTAATIAEARRLWNEVRRPNLMIKVPATEAGLPAIRALIGEGINVNVTLLFSRAVYARVVEAYLSGLEQWITRGGAAARIASVASFFVSRIDTAVDRLIEDSLKTLPEGDDRAALAALRGTIAIANAKLAYQIYKRLFAGPRWIRLKEAGARPQRLLWASTSTKNPNYRDVLYVEELIGPATVNTMPPETLDAFRDHGIARASLEEGVDAAEKTLDALARFGISLDAVTAKLTREGVQLFADAFDDLMAAVERKRAALLGAKLNRQEAALPPDLQKAANGLIEDWRRGGKTRRLWDRDATLWTARDEAKWLGWLDIVAEERADVARLTRIAADARRDGFRHAVLIGMGGSSLGAEVFARTFGAEPGYPKLLSLDSTDPAEIRSVEEAIDPASTLFIVSSKSGTTLEPNIVKAHFWSLVRKACGPHEAGAHFLAITDPGTVLEREARAEGFRDICLGKPDIGGRYSVLSDFGLVPAAVAGVDAARLLDEAARMVRSCGKPVPPAENPGVKLGLILGALALQGRDKITILASPPLGEIGAWLEQLLAESTGKQGKGLIPIDGEILGPPDVYGTDRVFVYFRLDEGFSPEQDSAVSRLAEAGHPVIRSAIADRYQIGQEFFRWEMATAVAGAVLGINPFDQPDVEASKARTRALMQAPERTGSPAETPIFEDEAIKVFADERNSRALPGARQGAGLAAILKAHLARLRAGDYVALLAFIARNAANRALLTEIRTVIRDRARVATSAGFGPRFLHSTGQLFKGGPDTGLFLQITADPLADIPVPGQGYSFGAVLRVQATGDLAVLRERGRRVLRVHLGRDVERGLERIREAVREALA